MKKSVVSMSVGQPDAAAKIVREWMEDDIPPPESEPEQDPISIPEEGSKKLPKIIPKSSPNLPEIWLIQDIF